MSQLGRRPFRLAMSGFAVTSIFVSYHLRTDSESPSSATPRTCRAWSCCVHRPLLSLAVDPEVGTNRFYAPSTVTALMNAGWYAAIRALLLRRLERRD